MIKPTVAVSTQNEFIPHLSERTYIYLFPEIKNSEYVLFNTHTQRFYPFSTQKEMRIAINKFIKKREYQTIYRSKNILLYKKINIYSE